MSDYNRDKRRWDKCKRESQRQQSRSQRQSQRQQARSQRQADRRQAPLDRQRQRQEARQRRIETRQNARTDRVNSRTDRVALRQENRTTRTLARQNPLNVAARAGAVGGAIEMGMERWNDAEQNFIGWTSAYMGGDPAVQMGALEATSDSSYTTPPAASGAAEEWDDYADPYADSYDYGDDVIDPEVIEEDDDESFVDEVTDFSKPTPWVIGAGLLGLGWFLLGGR